MRKLGVEEWLVRAVMAMYKHARTRIRIRSYGGSVSEWFGVNVGVHPGLVLSPLLFIIVLEAVTHSVREGLSWEMLYADDLVLVGKCEEELKEKLRKWNECLKDKGLKINEEKTKVMCESFGTGTTQVIGNVKHPCSVCLKGFGMNSNTVCSAILKKDTDRLVEVQGAFRSAYRKRDESEVKRNHLYNMHKTCNVVWQ